MLKMGYSLMVKNDMEICRENLSFDASTLSRRDRSVLSGSLLVKSAAGDDSIGNYVIARFSTPSIFGITSQHS